MNEFLIKERVRGSVWSNVIITYYIITPSDMLIL